VFQESEADFVILPARVFRVLKFFTRLGVHQHIGPIRRRLQEVALVVRPGWRFLKGANAWETLYLRGVNDFADRRLNDFEICQMADGFVCDYVCILRKIARGELRAAQRLVHRDLAEINFQLLHELKLRRGERSFPEGRRIERVTSSDELSAVTIDTRLDASEFQFAVRKSAIACRELMFALVGQRWRWPTQIQ
jgi:hypothetical protein